MKSAKKVAPYFYNHETNTLQVTKAFLKAAGNLYTPEYRIIQAYRNDHPTMIISTGEARKGTARIAYAQMKEYITALDKSGKMLEQFETVKLLSKIQPSPYNYVKCWFAETYPNYKEALKTDADGKLYFVKLEKSGKDGSIQVAKKIAEVVITPAQPEPAPGTVAVAHPELMEAPKSEETNVPESQEIAA